MNIVILGLPGVGKSEALSLWRFGKGPFARQPIVPKLKMFRVFDTDDYNTKDFEGDLYRIRNAVFADRSPDKIVIGVQGFRFLRKGLQLRDWYADEVWMCTTATDDERRERYFKREGKSPNPGFDKALFTIWSDYKAMLLLEKNKPLIKEIRL